MSSDVTLNGSPFSVPEAGEVNYGVSLNTYLRALSAARGGFLFFGATVGVDASETVYLQPGWSGSPVNSPLAIPAPCTGRVAALAFDVGDAETGDTITCTVMKNGVATALVSTRPIGSTGVQVVTTGFSVSAGDRIAVRVVGGPGANQEGPMVASIVLQPNSSATP